MEITWEQRQELAKQEETDAYKGLVSVFQKLQAVDKRWTLIPNVDEPLRKFHGTCEINGVKINVGLRKTNGRYDYTKGLRPVAYWIAISVPALMRKYEYDRSNRQMWCTHYKWTPTTKGLVKKILVESKELAANAKVIVDEQIKKEIQEKKEEQERETFQKNAEATIPRMMSDSYYCHVNGETIAYNVRGMTLEQAQHLEKQLVIWGLIK